MKKIHQSETYTLWGSRVETWLIFIYHVCFSCDGSKVVQMCLGSCPQKCHWADWGELNPWRVYGKFIMQTKATHWMIKKLITISLAAGQWALLQCPVLLQGGCLSWGQMQNLQKLPVHCAFQTGHFLQFNIIIDHLGEVGVGPAGLWRHSGAWWSGQPRLTRFWHYYTTWLGSLFS